ncbi:MAG TPA: glycosyltransferase 87 family protein [Corynebacterium sp.]|nr:glycosyltransferase 87 family protein [Corynebacterium sp.]
MSHTSDSPAPSPRTGPREHPHLRNSPAATEPVAHGFIAFLGGGIGRHARPGSARWWTPVRVLTLVALVFLSFGFLSKAACLRGTRGEDGTAVLDWSGNRQYLAACYNDIIPLYHGRGLDQPGFPYAYSWSEGDLTRYMEYPVLAGLFQGGMGWLTRLTYPVIEVLPLPLAESAWYFCVTAFVLAGFWVLTIRIVAALAGNRIWDTILVAASPVLIVHAFTNWDIPSVTAAAAAVLLVKHNRPGWAGVAIGLGAAFKLWPLFLLGAYLVLAVRSHRWAPLLHLTLAAVATWTALNLPVLLAYPAAWGEFLRLNRERSWEWTTVWAVLARATGWSGFDTDPGTPAILNAVTFGLFASACLAVFLLGIRVRRRPRVAELIFLIVAAFLLCNKVWSPQYSLWLLVPAVLAVPRWRLLLGWMCAELMVWPVLMWHMHGPEHNGAPGGLLNLVILIRGAFIMVMIVFVIRQLLGREPDKVAAAHQGLDPLAGAFGWVDRLTPGSADRRDNLEKKVRQC